MCEIWHQTDLEGPNSTSVFITNSLVNLYRILSHSEPTPPLHTKGDNSVFFEGLEIVLVNLPTQRLTLLEGPGEGVVPYDGSG